MGNLGAWQSPFPLRLGGNSHARTQHLFDAIRANVGSALISEYSATNIPANVAEDIAAARLLSIADRAIDRRIAQGDPRKLTTRLQDWEAILGIVPEDLDGPLIRRNRVAARLLANFNGAADGISRLAEAAFYPWATGVHFAAHGGTVERHWAGFDPDADKPWFSKYAQVCVSYVRPDHATETDVQQRRAAAASALDDYLAAWATFTFGEMLPGDPFGFVIGHSRIGYAALTS